MSKSKIAMCQEISNQINQKYNPRYLACPGVDRLTSQENDIVVIDSHYPYLEFHLFPYVEDELGTIKSVFANPVSDKEILDSQRVLHEFEAIIRKVNHLCLTDYDR